MTYNLITSQHIGWKWEPDPKNPGYNRYACINVKALLTLDIPQGKLPIYSSSEPMEGYF